MLILKTKKISLIYFHHGYVKIDNIKDIIDDCNLKLDNYNYFFI